MSLGTSQGLWNYASLQGLTVPGEDLQRLLDAGSAYLRGAYWNRLQGSPVSSSELFPRSGVVGLPSDAVPLAAVEAEYEASLAEFRSPGTLSGTSNPSVTREYVSGAVGREYSKESGKMRSRLNTVEDRLMPWLLVDSHTANLYFGSAGPRDV